MPETEELTLTPEETEELSKLLTNVPQKDEKHGVFIFFDKVLKTLDTKKAAYLKQDELQSVRAYNSAALYAEEMGLNKVKDYINKEAEIILATSLSKDGFLIKSVITQKKEMTAKAVTEKKKKWLETKGSES